MAARTRKVNPTREWKDQIQASMLMNRLRDHGLGKIDLSPAQVKSIEVILSKLVPSLSSVEQTITDERDTLQDSDLATRLASLFAEKPGLFEQVVAIGRAAIARQSMTEQGLAPVEH